MQASEEEGRPHQGLAFRFFGLYPTGIYFGLKVVHIYYYYGSRFQKDHPYYGSGDRVP